MRATKSLLLASLLFCPLSTTDVRAGQTPPPADEVLDLNGAWVVDTDRLPQGPPAGGPEGPPGAGPPLGMMRSFLLVLERQGNRLTGTLSNQMTDSPITQGLVRGD